VLSSLHATDTIAALYRLLNMGVESFAVASATIGMVAQRLVRRICPNCEVLYEPSAEEYAFYSRYSGEEKDLFVRGEGCDKCSRTGYYDRIGVYEILGVNEKMRQALVENASPGELRELAVANGMRSLREQAVRLVARDMTTIHEVLRTVYIAEGTG
jgi:type IV pilus assembly protein PilB